MEAKIRARNVQISTKETVEVCGYIRGRKVDKALQLLEEVLEHKKAIPYKMYNWDRGHKPGRIMSGAYPQKTIKQVMIILNNVKKNAENLGMNTNDLVISHIVATKGPTQWHYGRMRRRKMKNTHLTVKLTEAVVKKENKK